jgi:hypothetical protein
MSIRLEVQLDGSIEIMRSWINDPMTRFLTLDSKDEEKYMRIIGYLVRREIRRVQAERFVPQVVREGRSLLKRKLKQKEI